jgi:hypothetical protein
MSSAFTILDQDDNAVDGNSAKGFPLADLRPPVSACKQKTFASDEKSERLGDRIEMGRSPANPTQDGIVRNVSTLRVKQTAPSV